MPRQISEKLTRKEMIDPQLEQAGWYLRDQQMVKSGRQADGLFETLLAEAFNA
jgi:hypothetical protein